MYTIKQIATDSEINACFKVMSQLRPHLTAETFIERVRLQMREAYHLVAALDDDAVVAVAGYRYSHSLSWGKYLYIDDLVTDSNKRSQGAGKFLLAWLAEEAGRHDCAEMHLDSGTQRKDAHRFYAREGMEMLAFHFKLSL